jgi:hypothetical protein
MNEGILISIGMICAWYGTYFLLSGYRMKEIYIPDTRAFTQPLSINDVSSMYIGNCFSR